MRRPRPRRLTSGCVPSRQGRARHVTSSEPHAVHDREVSAHLGRGIDTPLPTGCTCSSAGSIRRDSWRLSRGTLVNVDQITKVTPMPGGTSLVTLANGQDLQVSRIQSRLLRETLLKL